MPKTALADTLEEWDALLASMDNPEILAIPQMKEMRDALEAMIGAVKALSAEQDSLQARRQAVTQHLRITRGHGQDLVIKVRASLKGHFGHRFEGLVRYRIRPVRRRSRATREEVGITPAATQALLAGLPGLATAAPADSEALRASRTDNGAARTAPEALADPSGASPGGI